MGIQLRGRRRSVSEKTVRRTLSEDLDSAPPTPDIITTSRSLDSPSPAIAAGKEMRIRAKSICNSTNLHQLHRLQLQEQLAPPSATPPPASEDPWSEKNLQAAIDLWKLDEDQIARLKELQHNLKDCDHHFKYDPHIILRFMTSPLAKDAEPLFRKMVQWRIDNDIDNMLFEYKPPQILLDYNPTAILKDYDREGDPIYVERGGATDGRGMMKRFSREELMTYMIYTRELNTQGAWLKEYEQRMGRKVKDVTVVYDLKGLNSSHLNPSVLDFFRDVQTLNQEKYPGPIKRMIIIRAPRIFCLAWNIVKHFFPQSSRDKMIFAGKHYNKVLEKYIDLDVLPPCIYEGGKGEAATGLPPRMEGGIIPDHVQPVRHQESNASATRSFLSLDSFEGTEQGSLASTGDGEESDTSFNSL